MFLKYINYYRAGGLELSEAISKAIKRCIGENYIADFLRKEGKEVATMIFDEITQEEFAEIRANEAAEEAFKKGEAQGLRKGEAQGIRKGEAQKTFEIARMMIEEGLPSEMIVKVTGLSKEQIEKL